MALTDQDIAQFDAQQGKPPVFTDADIARLDSQGKFTSPKGAPGTPGGKPIKPMVKSKFLDNPVVSAIANVGEQILPALSAIPNAIATTLERSTTGRQSVGQAIKGAVTDVATGKSMSMEDFMNAHPPELAGNNQFYDTMKSFGNAVTGQAVDLAGNLATYLFQPAGELVGGALGKIPATKPLGEVVQRLTGTYKEPGKIAPEVKSPEVIATKPALTDADIAKIDAGKPPGEAITPAVVSSPQPAGKGQYFTLQDIKGKTPGEAYDFILNKFDLPSPEEIRNMPREDLLALKEKIRNIPSMPFRDSGLSLAESVVKGEVVGGSSTKIDLNVSRVVNYKANLVEQALEKTPTLEPLAGKVEPTSTQFGGALLPTREELTASIQRIKADAGKILNPEVTDLQYQTANRMAGRRIEAKLGTMAAEDTAKGIWKVLPRNSKEAALAANAIEQPGKYLGSLNPSQQAAVAGVKAHFDNLYQVAKGEGVEMDYIDNYLTHLYKDDPAKIKKVFYPKGGSLGTGFRFANGRSIPTIEEAKAVGLHPVEDVGSLAGVYENALRKTIANKHLVDSLQGMNNKAGNPVISSKFVEGYVPLNEPSLARYVFTGSEKKTVVPLAERERVGVKPFTSQAEAIAAGATPKETTTTLLAKPPIVWVDPEIAPTLKRIISPFEKSGNFAKGYFNMRYHVKRLLLYNPLIHFWNVGGNAFNEAWTNPIGSVKAWKFIRQNPEMVDKEMVTAGVNLTNLGKTIDAIRQDVMDEASRKGVTLMGKDIPIVTDVTRKAEAINDKILWQGMVPNLERFTWQITKQRMKINNPAATVQEINTAASAWVNKLMGTLPNDWINYSGKKWGSILLLARNWTFSNIDEVAAMSGRGLGTQGMTPVERSLMSQEARRFWTKTVTGFLVTSDTANYLASGHHLWENEEGHKLDINTGAKDKQGRDIYVPNPMYRAMRDIVGWTFHPARTALNKMEPTMKAGAEEILNEHFWNKQPIAPPGATAGESIQARAQHLGAAWTPLKDIYGQPGQVRTPVEKGAPFFGVWVSHGLLLPETVYTALPPKSKKEFLKSLTPQEAATFERMKIRGRVVGEIAQKLKKVSDRAKYVRSQQDPEVNKLIQQGNKQGAIQLMHQQNRYRTSAGMRNRLKRYEPDTGTE